MQKPFKFIDSTIANRKDFLLNEGYQPTHAIFYLKNGKFTIDFGDKKEKIQQGDCCILPNNIHFQRKIIKPISFIYIKFACNEKCPFSINLPYGKITFKDNLRFVSTMDILENLLLSNDIRSIYLKEHLFEDILLQIFYENTPTGFQSEKNTVSDSLLNCALKWIDNTLDKKITIYDLCRSLGTNASTLNFKFRKELGTSIWQYILNERMKKAHHLIISTNYSISEIALKCGFNNVYYFSTSFKKFYGTSPKKFKNQYFGIF